MGGEFLETFFEHKRQDKYANDSKPVKLSADTGKSYEEIQVILNYIKAIGASESITLVTDIAISPANDLYRRCRFKVNATGVIYDNLDQALAAIKRDSRAGQGIDLRSREKNVSSTSPVSVSRRGNGIGSNYSYGRNTVGAIAVANNDKKKRGSYSSRRSVRHDDFVEVETETDLNHYGVLGMKWGVRKDPQRAYERANKKLTALDKRATKAGAKASRKETRSLRRQQRADTAWIFPKTKAKLADWAIGRSEKARQKYVKKMSRAVSWYKEMENAFRGTKIDNLNSNYVALGEKYSKIQVNDLMMNAQASLANKQLRMIYRQMGK